MAKEPFCADGSSSLLPSEKKLTRPKRPLRQSIGRVTSGLLLGSTLAVAGPHIVQRMLPTDAIVSPIPSWKGDTRIAIPDVTVSFDTHDTPIALELQPRRILPLLENGTPSSIKKDAAQAVALWAGLAFGFMALGISLRWYDKSDAKTLRSAAHAARNGVAIASATWAIGGVATLPTYNDQAFKNPHIDISIPKSSLSGADLKNSLANYKKIGERLKEDLHEFAALEELIPKSENAISALAVSHLQSATCGYDNLYALVKAFDIDIVFNAGDETKWGLPVEKELFSSEKCEKTPADLGVPMVFANGNHSDTPESFKNSQNVIIMDGRPKEIFLQEEGKTVVLRVLGTPSPYVSSNPITDIVSGPSSSVSPADLEKMLEESGQESARLVKKNPKKIDILLANDKRTLEAAFKELKEDAITPADLPFGIAGSTADPRSKGQIVTTGSFGGLLHLGRLTFATLELAIDTKTPMHLTSTKIDVKLGKITKEPMEVDKDLIFVPVTLPPRAAV